MRVNQRKSQAAKWLAFITFAMITAVILLVGITEKEMSVAEAATIIENRLGDSEDDEDDFDDEDDYDEDEEDDEDDEDEEDAYEKGDEFTVSLIDYEITKLGSSPEVKVVGYEGKKTSLTIKDTVTDEFDVTYKVTAIGEEAFEGSRLLSIKLGKNINTISSKAFSKCKRLRSVTLSANLRKIGTGAFSKCVVLKKIVIPVKTTEIGKDAFNGCKKLSTIQFKSSQPPKFGSNCFKGINKKAVFKVPAKKKAVYAKKLTSKTGNISSMRVK